MRRAGIGVPWETWDPVLTVRCLISVIIVHGKGNAGAVFSYRIGKDRSVWRALAHRAPGQTVTLLRTHGLLIVDINSDIILAS